MQLESLLQTARQAGASDLILVAGKPPCVYIHGKLQSIDDTVLTDAGLREMLEPVLGDVQRRELETSGDSDFSLGGAGFGRVRCNVHRQRGSYAAAIRFVNTRIPGFDELHLPRKLAELADLPRGLVLVTGATGSGKSTTLAAMIEHMNEHARKHIITLEDPIEFVFTHRNCVIEQREIGHDSPSFAHALRHVVRQKPDVILVGEMRDRETIATALTASETGHLVLGTLHTNSAAQTIERVIDVFDAAQQPQIRVQLAGTLRAVICQSLLRTADGTGMIPALEIMVMTPAIRRAIRESETHLIPGMIETGQKFGMTTLDASLAELVRIGRVTADAARATAADPEKLDRLIGAARGRVVFSAVDAPGLESASEPALSAGSTKPWH